MRNATLFIIATLLVGCSGLVIPRFPSNREDVVFDNGAVRLSGILAKPAGAAPYPAVVLVHGSGPSKHDEAAWKIHARAFADHGFAVLVYDKRGSGASTGNLDASTYQDIAADLGAAVRYLRSRRDIQGDRIGFLGRSEGGWVAPIAANEVGRIAFVILSSGAAVTPLDQTLYEIRTRLEKEKFGAADVEEALTLRTRIWKYYARAASEPEQATEAERQDIDAALQAAQQKLWFKSSELPKALPPYDAAKYRIWSAMRYYDPRADLMRLDAPVLAVFGEDDENIPVTASVAILKQIKDAAKKDITIEVLPDTGHSLMARGKIPPRYAPRYLDLVSTWAAGRVSR